MASSALAGVRSFATSPFSSCRSPFRGYGSVLGPYSSSRQLPKIFQNQVEVLPNKGVIRGFCASADQDLALKKCVPCNSKDIRPITEQAAQELLPKVEGWNIVSDDGTFKLHRSWKVKSFTKGLEFFQLVADVANAEGHHPDLHLVGWNNVKIDIWTHSAGGLTENDFILAAKINSLNLDGLLRRTAASKQ